MSETEALVDGVFHTISVFVLNIVTVGLRCRHMTNVSISKVE